MKLMVTPIVMSALGTILIGLVNRMEDLEIRGQVEIHPNFSISKIDQNTEKSLGDLRKFAVTQTPVKNHQVRLV